MQMVLLSAQKLDKFDYVHCVCVRERAFFLFCVERQSKSRPICAALHTIGEGMSVRERAVCNRKANRQSKIRTILIVAVSVRSHTMNWRRVFFRCCVLVAVSKWCDGKQLKLDFSIVKCTQAATPKKWRMSVRNVIRNRYPYVTWTQLRAAPQTGTDYNAKSTVYQLSWIYFVFNFVVVSVCVECTSIHAHVYERRGKNPIVWQFR